MRILKIMLLAYYITILVSCNTLELNGNDIDCREAITCGKDGCIKYYKGSECSPDQKEVRERKYPRTTWW